MTEPVAAADSAGVALTLGQVYYLKCNLCDPPKPKFFVVVLCEPLKLVIINTAVNDYSSARPQLAAGMTPLYLSANFYLKHDSYIDCNWISHEYSAESLAKAVKVPPHRLVGQLDATSMELLQLHWPKNHLITRKYRAQLSAAWGSVPPSATA